MIITENISRHAADYEAPQMQVVPIRTSGMLCASGGGTFTLTNVDSDHVTISQSGLWDGGSGSGSGSSDSYTPGNSASGEMTSLDNTSGWGSGF